jgi:large subunit ribosomal protein L10
MPKTKDQKKVILDELKEKVKKSKSIIFATFSKLPVKKNEELRIELKKEQSEYFVAKKTLLDIALKDSEIDAPMIKECKQNISVVFGYNDEVAPAKIVEKFKKANPETIEIYGGIIDRNYINSEQAVELAKIPGKQELYASIVGSINAPISGFVNALAGNIRNLVSVLHNISEKKLNINN